MTIKPYRSFDIGLRYGSHGYSADRLLCSLRRRQHVPIHVHTSGRSRVFIDNSEEVSRIDLCRVGPCHDHRDLESSQ